MSDPEKLIAHPSSTPRYIGNGSNGGGGNIESRLVAIETELKHVARTKDIHEIVNKVQNSTNKMWVLCLTAIFAAIAAIAAVISAMS